MSISKLDYDELVRLRDDGCKYVARDSDGAIGGFEKKPRRTKKYWSDGKPESWTPSCIDHLYCVTWNTEPLNIAAAIAEYERAREGK